MTKKEQRKRYLAKLVQAIVEGREKLLEQDGDIWPVRVA